MKQTMQRYLALFLAAVVPVLCFAGCGAKTLPAQEVPVSAYIQPVAMEVILDEAVALGAEPALNTALTPTASGTCTEKNSKAVIDYSNAADGYFMTQFTATTSNRLKVQVKGPSGTTYTYNLTPAQWTVFPFSDGNGSYKITVCENVSGTSYAQVLSKTVSVQLTSEFAPFLLPNQYVNFTPESATVKKAEELLKGKTATLDKVGAVYDFVVKNFSYDKQKAATVQSGYLPDVDAILASKTGICFDYAAVMAAMLRSQGVPTKLVVGYSGNIYHAWVNVYSETEGWIDAAIFFDGAQWKLMDPTFASTGKGSEAIMKYIGNGANYSEKYLY